MTQIPQEPLSPLVGDLHFAIKRTNRPPTWIPDIPYPIHRMMHFTFIYFGGDAWNATTTCEVPDYDPWGPFPNPCTTTYSVSVWCTLSFSNDVTGLTVYASPARSLHWTEISASLLLGGAEQGHPWDAHWQTLTNHTLNGTVELHAYRNVSPLAPLLPMFVSSPTVHGVIGDHCVFRAPLYPEGAVYGETPPNGYGTRMRNRPRNVVYTDSGHASRRLNFQSAASQWQALTAGQQADWNQAAQTLKPPTSGYALWTQIIATRRTDLIPTLNARTGKTLVVPDFPA